MKRMRKMKMTTLKMMIFMTVLTTTRMMMMMMRRGVEQIKGRPRSTTMQLRSWRILTETTMMRTWTNFMIRGHRRRRLEVQEAAAAAAVAIGVVVEQEVEKNAGDEKGGIRKMRRRTRARLTSALALLAPLSYLHLPC
jgi:hypothetical protein